MNDVLIKEKIEEVQKNNKLIKDVKRIKILIENKDLNKFLYFS